jgi:dephospho-CoA kinase
MVRKVKYLDTKLVAVTGGIGSGQTTVSKMLDDLGAKVINVDRKVKQLMQRDAALQRELRHAFGKQAFNEKKELNNKWLAEIVFSDETKLQMLNRIVHPRMVAEIVEEMEAARFSGKFPIVVVDAALIYEVSIEQMFDIIIVVNCRKDTRIKRVMQRDDMKRDDVLSRMRHQIPLEEKAKWADVVITNNGTEEELKKSVDEAFEKITADLRVVRLGNRPRPQNKITGP